MTRREEEDGLRGKEGEGASKRTRIEDSWARTVQGIGCRSWGGPGRGEQWGRRQDNSN